VIAHHVLIMITSDYNDDGDNGGDGDNGDGDDDDTYRWREIIVKR